MVGLTVTDVFNLLSYILYKIYEQVVQVEQLQALCLTENLAWLIEILLNRTEFWNFELEALWFIDSSYQTFELKNLETRRKNDKRSKVIFIACLFAFC